MLIHNYTHIPAGVCTGECTPSSTATPHGNSPTPSRSLTAHLQQTSQQLQQECKLQQEQDSDPVVDEGGSSYPKSQEQQLQRGWQPWREPEVAETCPRWQSSYDSSGKPSESQSAAAGAASASAGAAAGAPAADEEGGAFEPLLAKQCLGGVITACDR